MELAYPGGPQTIPPKKRPYLEIDPSRPVTDYLPPAPVAACVVQELSRKDGAAPGYEFRLGSTHFPHIKLRVQWMECQGKTMCVYTVDTHDAFSRQSVQPPPDHPDAAGWSALQEANRQLKDRVEDALEDAGFLTFKNLLRLDLSSR